MLSIFILIFILLTGTFSFFLFMKKSFSESALVVCSGIVILLFLIGQFGDLSIGVYAIIAISIGLFLFNIIYGIKQGNIIKSALTPFLSDFGLYAFLGFTLVILWISYGLVPYGFDEFSHWADIVKVMSELNDFGTNPASKSMFPAYLPGMALFQYFLQKINTLVTGNNFCEWLLYPAYQLFTFSFLLPVFSQIKKKATVWSKFLLSLVLFLAQFLFIVDAYRYVYIEVFFSTLIAAGFFQILWNRKKDTSYYISMASILTMLVLVKSPGMMFATFLGVYCVLQEIFEKKSGKLKIKGVLIYTLSLLVPKLLWTIHLSLPNKLSGESVAHSFRKNVIISYFKALTTEGVVLGNTGIKINYFIVFLLFVAVLLYLFRFQMEYYKWPLIAFFVTLAIYIIGTGFTYATGFSKREATALICLDRYLCVAYLPLWYITLLSIAIRSSESIKGQNYRFFLLLLLVLSTIQLDMVSGVLLRNHVSTAKESRMEFIGNLNEKSWTADDKILYIWDDIPSGTEIQLRYCFRPADLYIRSSDECNIGEYEGFTVFVHE